MKKSEPVEGRRLAALMRGTRALQASRHRLRPVSGRAGESDRGAGARRLRGAARDVSARARSRRSCCRRNIARSWTMLRRLYRRFEPDVVVHFGLTGRAKAIHVETRRAESLSIRRSRTLRGWRRDRARVRRGGPDIAHRDASPDAILAALNARQASAHALRRCRRLCLQRHALSLAPRGARRPARRLHPRAAGNASLAKDAAWLRRSIILAARAAIAAQGQCCDRKICRGQQHPVTVSNERWIDYGLNCI